MLSNVGDMVHLKHPQHSWVLARVQSVDAGARCISCVTDDPLRGQCGEMLSNVAEANTMTVMGSTVDEDVEDLLQLTVLHDATLLRCLCRRYMNDHIYTNIGAIVVALNPFTFTIPWYKDDQMEKYLDEGERIEKNVPHSWAQAHNTYFELLRDASPQFILVSGESGSGKTEASKMVVKYFAAISKRRGDSATAERSAQCGVKLSQCSPILEAFGNAKTVRNDNSSRFGKFMKIQFDPATRLLAGSHTTRYLLEKSRIIVAAEGERVYHSFYLIHKGPRAAALGLRSQADYSSVMSGQTLDNGDFNTLEEYNEVVAAMTTVGLSDVDIDSTWSITSGVLSLVNVAFEAKSQGGDDGVVVTATTERDLAATATLWQIEHAALQQELVSTELVVRGESSRKKLTKAQAGDVRDALCKCVYDGLFGYLVEQCNRMCDFGDTGNWWIGLLDIFGFEDFKRNSFEQLCINLANETLQGHYNTYIFDKDIEECKAEGVDTAAIVCPDNGPCIALVTSPANGILALLDDECALATGNDGNFLEAAAAAHKDHAYFIKNKTSKSHFGVRHYAGDVSYDVAGWVDKNRDTLKDALRLLARSSTNGVMSRIVAAPVERRGRPITVGGFFKQQLAELMQVINSSNPHWIRCVKPHPAKKPRMFDGLTTMNQLESSGVLGTVKIRKAGYPVRMTFVVFARRFAVLMMCAKDSWVIAQRSKGDGNDLKPSCLKALTDSKLANPAQWQCGRTKLFLKAEAYVAMEACRSRKMLEHVVRMQAAGRTLKARKAYWREKYRRAVETIAKHYRAYVNRTASLREMMRRVVEEKMKQVRAQAELCVNGRAIEEAAIAAEFSSELCSALVLMEEARRSMISAEFDRAVRGYGVSFELDVLEAREAAARAVLVPRLEALLGLARLDGIEEIMHQVALSERFWRREILAEETTAFLDIISGTDAIEALREHEGNRRATIVASSRDNFRAMMGEHFVQLRKWLADGPERTCPGCEPAARRRILEEESSERRLRKAFERKLAWDAALRTVVGDESDERAYLALEYEPHFRGLITEEFEMKHLLIEGKSLMARMLVAERNIRRGIFELQMEAFAGLAWAEAQERWIRKLANVEMEEIRFRGRVAFTETCNRQIIADSMPPLWVVEAVGEIHHEETYWRDQLTTLWRKSHAVKLQTQAAQLRVLVTEERFRRIMFLLWSVNLVELRERRLVVAEEAAFRKRMYELDHADSIRESVRVRLRTAALNNAEDALWRSVERQRASQVEGSAERLARNFPQFDEQIRDLYEEDTHWSPGRFAQERYLVTRHAELPGAYEPMWSRLRGGGAAAAADLPHSPQPQGVPLRRTALEVALPERSPQRQW